MGYAEREQRRHEVSRVKSKSQECPCGWTYEETIDYLYTRTPLFQQQGVGAYKEGLATTQALDAHFGHPHRRYPTIHIAGTNGKGSCSCTIASILQEAGYRVGLYTSPHLTDFRERIRVNGEMIGQEEVVRFVEEERAFFEPLYPSFFELTTALAFKYFADSGVDVAVVEVGLGGRLDCTNIIHPVLSLITNISLDHTNLLGSTLPQIAQEKAGIIKAGVPVVIGEADAELRVLFTEKAKEVGAPILFAEDEVEDFPVHSALQGDYQAVNTRTILAALPWLRGAFPLLSDAAIKDGFAHVVGNTGLRGRWQQLSDNPLTLCDIAHNEAGWRWVFGQLQALGQPLHIVFGLVNDKDVQAALSLMPHAAHYYFCQPSVARAFPCERLANLAHASGLRGEGYPSVQAAYEAARSQALPEEVIFIGGSNFVVADLLK